MDSRAKDLIIQNIPLLKVLTEKLSAYQVVKIDLQRIIYFISQFETYERIEVIIKLIQSVDFIDSNRMTFLLKKAFEKIPENFKSKPLISSLGSIQDSSAVVCYQLLKQLFDSEEAILNLITDVNSIGKSLESESPSSIIFFDDNITSGTQLADFFEELIDGKAQAEMVKIPLTASEFEALKKTPIRVCYAIQLTEESNNIVNSLKVKYNIDLEIYSGKVDFNNHLDFQSNTMKSEEEAKFTREFIREISEPLYEDKNWSTDTVYNRLLGYGNLGKLTVFYYNVPKSLIPVFWKSGNYNGKPWIPLFPETQQQKKIIENNIKLEYYQLEAINSWINSIPQNRKPNIKFGFLTNEGITQHISVKIPSKNFIEKQFLKYFTSKKKEYEPNVKQSRRDNIQSMLQNIYPTSSDSVSTIDYQKYRNAIDEYNKQIEDYNILFKDYIHRQASNYDVVFQIANSGNIAATNSTVKVNYNSGELLLNDFDDLPKPTFDKSKPVLSDYDKENRYGRVVMSTTKFAPLSFGPKREPIIENTYYDYKLFENLRIGHNNNQNKKVEVTRMNLEKYEFEIPYEINFDEEAETINGELKITFEESEEMTQDLRDAIYKSIDKLKLK
ncbi:phosphoribosyltransferase-like protein [Pedobacter sp. WC2501]|uniref:phosphoribosyltransferase-like protein n=1 Tax=Pedobacter sp. WC2501 TaxID=3461400 RepID=UPI0040465740